MRRRDSAMAEKRIDTDGAQKVIDAFRRIDQVLKIFNFEAEAISGVEIKELIAQRSQARLDKNWAIADKIRDELEAKGVAVCDTKVID